MTDDRMSLGLITDIVDVPDRDGFVRGDYEHVGGAILLISDLARIYKGSQDEPVGPYVGETPSRLAPSEPPGPGSQTAITVPSGELKAVLAALDIAADYKHDRAEMCTNCPDQSWPTCQTRLHDARAYDQLADRILQAAEAAPGIHQGHTEPPGPPRQASPAADKEAGP